MGKNEPLPGAEHIGKRPKPGTTWAPYNFVPFSNKILLPYPEGLASLPAHDEICPDLKTGEIQITLTAETPVFVSDGQRVKAAFFRGVNGNLMIPGSTVRGLIRENMQILGFGLIRKEEGFEDRRIYFREMASGSRTLGANLKEAYKNALDVVPEAKKQGNGTISVPLKVMAGYILRKDGKYLIYPTQGNRYIRICRKHPDAVKLCTDENGVFHDRFAETLHVTYTGEGKNIRLLPSNNSGGKSEPVKKGTLLFTGRWVGKPEDRKLANSLYLFPEIDWNGEPTPVSDDDILSYRADYEERKNSLKGNLKTWKVPKEAIEFWNLSEDENAAPSPVFYARVDGHTYFGMTLFLRIGYQHTIADGLPAYHKELNQRRETELLLDYPHGILGFADDAGSSYRSRVSVEDFTLTAGGEPVEEFVCTPGGPKPSFYPGYLRDAPQNPNSLPPASVKARNYNNDSFLLRGYKQYWMRREAVKPLPPKKMDAASTVKLRLLPKGSEFTGVIRYKNLTEQELGLLLWSIRLDDGCYHSIGMGKPYGFGRMKVQIHNLLETVPAKLYDGLTGSPPFISSSGTAAARVQDYIRAYDKTAEEMLEQVENELKVPVTQADSIRKRPEIQDFFHMKSTLLPVGAADSESLYMRVDSGDYRNLKKPLPTVAELREQHEEEPEEPEPMSMADLLAALKAKADKGRL